MSIPSIDVEIASEERLIRIYEAEIKLLQAHAEQRKLGEEEEDDDEDDNDASIGGGAGSEADDPLDWILQQGDDEESTMSSLHASLASFQQEMGQHQHRLQPLIRGFCFISVQRKGASTTTTTTTTTTTSSATSASYSMRGYFTALPSLHARIQIEFSKKQISKESSEKPNNDTKRIQSLRCELLSSSASPDVEDWSWLERSIQVRQNDLAAWLEAVSTYLEFHQKRQKFLTNLQEQYAEILSVAVQHHRGKVLLQVSSPSKNNSTAGNTILSLVWGWKWKEGRDVLRLTQSSLASSSSSSSSKDGRTTTATTVGQPHLNALVQVCDDQCDAAVKLLLEQIDRAIHHSSNDNEDQNNRMEPSSLRHDAAYADDEGDEEDDASGSDRDDIAKSKEKAKRKRSNVAGGRSEIISQSRKKKKKRGLGGTTSKQRREKKLGLTKKRKGR